MPTEEQIAKNPAVDPKIVKEAQQMRRELEELGVWEDSGSRVSNPFETKPTSKPREEKQKSAHHAEPMTPIGCEKNASLT